MQILEKWNKKCYSHSYFEPFLPLLCKFLVSENVYDFRKLLHKSYHPHSVYFRTQIPCKHTFSAMGTHTGLMDYVKLNSIHTYKYQVIVLSHVIQGDWKFPSFSAFHSFADFYDLLGTRTCTENFKSAVRWIMCTLIWDNERSAHV